MAPKHIRAGWSNILGGRRKKSRENICGVGGVTALSSDLGWQVVGLREEGVTNRLLKRLSLL